MSFEKEVQRFARKFEKDVTQVAQFAAIQIYSATVISTPVDFGFAKNSWRLTQDAVDLSTGTNSGNDGSQLVNPAPGKPTTYYITNNVPYITYLERGSSQQAPQGMLARSTRNFRTFLRTASRKKR